MHVNRAGAPEHISEPAGMVKVAMAQHDFIEAGEVYAQHGGILQKGIALSGIKEISPCRCFNNAANPCSPRIPLAGIAVFSQSIVILVFMQKICGCGC